MRDRDKVQIKICGLTRDEDIACVNETMPDYAGFVFWGKSRRVVTVQQAAELKSQLRPDIQAVGVFVDEEPDVIIDLLDRKIIDVAQLHGNETEAQVRFIRECAKKPVIKAVRIRTSGDLIPWLDTEADYLLLDAGMGDGKTFDWNLIESVKIPFFLAGGLNLENVISAIEKTKPLGVDVSSGVETDGRKDPDKIRQIIRSVRDEQR